MEITMKEKDAISESLRAYVAKYPSQTKAAGSLKGVSVGTVSNILNGRYENISDEMFRNVASQVGGVSATGWQIVETGAYQEITGCTLRCAALAQCYLGDRRGRLWQEYHRPCLPPGA